MMKTLSTSQVFTHSAPFAAPALALALALAWGAPTATLRAENWTRFRGENGSAVAQETGALPAQWDNQQNLRWSVELPGPGSSSPIVLGDKVYLTCYTGYGVNAESPGNPKDLVRHLLCYDLKTGKELWRASVPSAHEEDPYDGFLQDHGYATSTPCTDGERIYVFFGKTGALAFSLDGKELWKQELGAGSGMNGWGSGTSPILHNNKLYINAAAEAQALYCLNPADGKVIWKVPAADLYGSWSTPVLVKAAEGKQELVLSAPFELWGLNPETGDFLWYTAGIEDNVVCNSPVVKDDMVYAVGGRGGAAVAVRSGGKEDANKDHVVWKGKLAAYVPSPVLYDNIIYSVSERGVLSTLDAQTGVQLYKERLPDAKNVYASPVVADGKLYVVTRKAGTFVVQTGKEFKLLATNKFTGDNSDFNASPVAVNNAVLLRSAQRLYCISNQ